MVFFRVTTAVARRLCAVPLGDQLHVHYFCGNKMRVFLKSSIYKKELSLRRDLPTDYLGKVRERGSDDTFRPHKQMNLFRRSHFWSPVQSISQYSARLSTNALG